MRIFRFLDGEVRVLGSLEALAQDRGGFAWVACTREEFSEHLASLQALLAQRCGTVLVDLHVSDLLNRQLPSRYDYTAQYDLLVFRRLSTGNGSSPEPTVRGGPPILRRIDTSPVGCALFENLLLSVHPQECAVPGYFADKWEGGPSEPRVAGARLPTSAPDLMLRIINALVDAFLDLRRELTHQLDHWQNELLSPSTRFNNWGALLQARLALHQLDEVCEDQRAAIQDWIEALKTWPHPTDTALAREYDLLQVRSRDVLEHIERVVHHVRRLEQSVESAIQMHFSAQSHRTNDIMRTLTALTAVFLPLNLIAGIFGMNFDAVPMLHSASGFWWAMGSMALIALLLLVLFWRKRYIARSGG